jgi:hypothetical protein
MSGQEVGVNSVVAVEASEQDAGRVHQVGGGEKVGDFFITQAPNSSGTALGRDEKVGDIFSVYDVSGARTESASASQSAKAAPAEESTQLIPATLPAAAPLGRRMGRPRAFTPELEEKVCMLLALGFSRRQAAAYLGIDSSTISHAAARDAELAAEFSRAEQMCDLQPEMALMAEAKKNWRAAAWYMQFRAKHPRPMTEAEKEERHQTRLADERRSAEASRTWMEEMRRSMDGTASPADSANVQVVHKTVRKPRRGK